MMHLARERAAVCLGVSSDRDALGLEPDASNESVGQLDSWTIDCRADTADTADTGVRHISGQQIGLNASRPGLISSFLFQSSGV